MTNIQQLSDLDPMTFAHMINALAMRVLGSGATGFGPGSDGGRDGYFEGEAPYPSAVDRWKGLWYIQSKFHAPHLSANAQKWLLARIKDEISAFEKPSRRRILPDNWIIATNIDPSGKPETGVFDAAKRLVKSEFPQLAKRFALWGGSKIIDLLSEHPDIAARYGHFLTPGHVITEIYDQLKDQRASMEDILRSLSVTAIQGQKHTKLDQAGSTADTRPGVHRLFIDLPFHAKESEFEGEAAATLSLAMAEYQGSDVDSYESKAWKNWRRHPQRAGIWFVKGGPGQGKSTIGQYVCQLNRAALLASGAIENVPPETKELVAEIRAQVENTALWPSVPRIPIYIELRSYAEWFAKQSNDKPVGVVTFIANQVYKGLQEPVSAHLMRRALRQGRWFIVFDGLDEVPSDTKDQIAQEICIFVAEERVGSDLFVMCTSRPQGYAGQFDSLPCAAVELLPLQPDSALRCAELLIRLDRSETEIELSMGILRNAMVSESIRDLMTTPLQAHIIAVIVRDGQRPPERKWLLYRQFYDVIRRREANRNLLTPEIATLLRQEDLLLKVVHNRLGLTLHTLAETARGANASLSRENFEKLVEAAVLDKRGEHAPVVRALMKAAEERLVLISTPDNSKEVRFHIRQLQEFFAAECISDGVASADLAERLMSIAADAHWREVMHFVLSSIIENNRIDDLLAALDVLTQVDEGDSDSCRTLRQRLRRGSLLVARLLEDGVLEQDRRIRAKVRVHVATLRSCVEPEVLKHLLQVRMPASQGWLIDVMMEEALDRDPETVIGAIAVLWRHLQDGDERTALTVEKFRQLPEASADYVIRIGGINGTWQARALLDWWESTSSVSALGSLDSAMHEDYTRVRPNEHLTAAIVERYGSDFLAFVEMAMRGGPSFESKVERYGPLRLTWHSIRIVPDEEIANAVRAVANVEVAGVLELLKLFSEFAGTNRRDVYLKCIHRLSDFTSHYALPYRLYKQFPLPRVSSSKFKDFVGSVEACTDDEFAKGLLEGRIGAWPIDATLNEVEHVPGSALLAADVLSMGTKTPYMIARLWLHGGRDELESLLRSEQDQAWRQALKEVFCSNVSSFVSCPMFWPHIFSFLGEDQTQFRAKICEAISLCEIGRQYFEFRCEGAAPMQFDLPNEKWMLVPIARGLLHSGEWQSSSVISAGSRESRLHAAGLVRKTVGALGSAEALCLLASDDDLRVREAALSLLVLHPFGGVSLLKQYSAHMLELVKKDYDVGSMIAVAVDMIGQDRDRVAEDLLSSCLAASKPTVWWSSWNATLRIWRERSTAPLTESGVWKQWLSDPD
jgi:hypothetical protein